MEKIERVIKSSQGVKQKLYWILCPGKFEFQWKQFTVTLFAMYCLHFYLK